MCSWLFPVHDIWEAAVGECLTPKESQKSLDQSCGSFVYGFLHLLLYCKSSLRVSFNWLLIIATSAHAYQKSMDADEDHILACAREATKTIIIILKFWPFGMNIQLECHRASGVTSC